MIVMRLNVNDVIPMNEHTWYANANCGIHVNFWSFRLMSFCLMIKKDRFKLKLLLWPQVPFNSFSIIKSFLLAILIRPDLLSALWNRNIETNRQCAILHPVPHKTKKQNGSFHFSFKLIVWHGNQFFDCVNSEKWFKKFKTILHHHKILKSPLVQYFVRVS